MNCYEINKLAKEIHQINLDNGFGVNEVTNVHCYMLIITEVAEMVEADRKNKYADVKTFKESLKALEECNFSTDAKNHLFKLEFQTRIKDTVEDEFADIMTRLLDFIALRDIKYEPLNYEMLTNDISDHKASEIGYLIIHTLLRESYIGRIIQLVIEIAEALNIDLWWHVKQKMRYNKLRGYKHGNKKY